MTKRGKFKMFEEKRYKVWPGIRWVSIITSVSKYYGRFFLFSSFPQGHVTIALLRILSASHTSSLSIAWIEG